MIRKLGITVVLFSASTVIFADAISDMFTQYKAQGVTSIDAKAGQAMWSKEFKNQKTGKMRSCTNCHGNDLTQAGKHVKTGKEIKPMAPSAYNKRLTDVKKIKKWFKRNCKWTVGRECSAQEQADILSYLQKL